MVVLAGIEQAFRSYQGRVLAVVRKDKCLARVFTPLRAASGMFQNVAKAGASGWLCSNALFLKRELLC
jgi:hypothetical protein